MSLIQERWEWYLDIAEKKGDFLADPDLREGFRTVFHSGVSIVLAMLRDCPEHLRPSLLKRLIAEMNDFTEFCGAEKH